jgi:hypothetical protein
MYLTSRTGGFCHARVLNVSDGKERGGVRESGKREREVWEEREKQWERENE